MNKQGALVLLALAPGWTQPLITTYAGNGNAGFSGDAGPAGQAMINQVVGLAWDSSGNLYLADQNNNRVRMVDKNGSPPPSREQGTPDSAATMDLLRKHSSTSRRVYARMFPVTCTSTIIRISVFVRSR
jgi:hypothetical protein